MYPDARLKMVPAQHTTGERYLMQLVLIRHLWGLSGKWEDLFPDFCELGYRGVEAPLPSSGDLRRFRSLLDQHQLVYIPQIFTAGRDVSEHVQSFRAQVEAAARAEPLLINSHSGQDRWTEAESGCFFEQALEIEREVGIKVAHETHRGRILFNPWVTARLVQRFADLRLCSDFSHWVCVSERLLDEEADAVQVCARRTIHLHARVGYEQGPQVPDPRAPEYASHLLAHEQWWRAIWQAQRERGDAASSLTPEFGPPPYQHTLPYSNVPVSDLWDVCNWQARRQAENFERWLRGGITGR